MIWYVGGFDPSSLSSAQPGLQGELRKALDDFISQHKIVLFMKGTQQVAQAKSDRMPLCEAQQDL